MTEKQAVEQVLHVLDECERRSRECERGVVALRNDGQAGIAQCGPNDLLLAQAFLNGAFIVDFNLN